MLVDGNGVPLAWTLTGGNRHDSTQLIKLVEQLPARAGEQPQRLTADRAYESNDHRQRLRTLGIEPQIAPRGGKHGSGLGRYRWVVERTFAWLHQFKRLLVRYDRRAEIHQAFLALGCCLLCFRRLSHSF